MRGEIDRFSAVFGVDVVVMGVQRGVTMLSITLSSVACLSLPFYLPTLTHTQHVKRRRRKKKKTLIKRVYSFFFPQNLSDITRISF